mmetsp:Transcript_111901/g.194281  ORF Transcript_111901/g.194281 Transcript_111901/m.194281 type:complete len:204 (+) Transcript_111901:738-1349(+)
MRSTASAKAAAVLYAICFRSVEYTAMHSYKPIGPFSWGKKPTFRKAFLPCSRWWYVDSVMSISHLYLRVIDSHVSTMRTVSEVVRVSMRSKVPMEPNITSPLLHPRPNARGMPPFSCRCLLISLFQFMHWMAASTASSAELKKAMIPSPKNLSMVPPLTLMYGMSPSSHVLMSRKVSSGDRRDEMVVKPTRSPKNNVNRFITL